MTPIRKSEYQKDGLVSRDGAVARGFNLSDVPVEAVTARSDGRFFAFSDPRGPAADRLRFLRMRLNQSWDPEKLKRVLITSPLPHEGKSTIALNLAITLAEEGKRRVLLLEGDLQRPGLSRELGFEDRPGVAECLENDADPRSFIRRIEPFGFYFLPGGKARGNPSELLHRPALQAAITTLSPHFDWILIDSPPVAPLTDTLSLKNQADATLLLARAGVTPTRAVDEALNLLGRKHVFGIILNAVEGLEQIYKKYYSAYTTPDPQ